jgi:hypothetical protein
VWGKKSTNILNFLSISLLLDPDPDQGAARFKPMSIPTNTVTHSGSHSLLFKGITGGVSGGVGGGGQPGDVSPPSMDEGGGGGGVPSGGAPIPSLAWPPEPMGDPASGDEDSLLGTVIGWPRNFFFLINYLPQNFAGDPLM